MSETWTNQLAKYSAKPVAWSDMFSAKAAALGQYMKSIDQGREHGDAIYDAERAVQASTWKHGLYQPPPDHAGLEPLVHLCLYLLQRHR